MSPYVLATANVDKAKEMSAVLGGLGLEVVPRPPDIADVEETENTLLGNALLKSRALAKATGMSAIADDSGLFVDALGGRPGVFSSRFAGEFATYGENVQKLLMEMQGVADRAATFRTIISVTSPDEEEIWVEGVLKGTILLERRGTNGFGYDPIFAPEGCGGRSFAQMTADEKNAISHRARALAALLEKLSLLK